ncbi:Do family serine endopeptidase [Aestuariivirga sp.]|uniref:Do family serine endopeptidase n=1 Tax=Aestuariivirga sp. TaxID=2650926 RepID=UPI0039E602D8
MNIVLRGLLGGTALAFAVVALPLPMTVPQAQAQAAELPSVADLADRLLPAVVEITVETKGPGGDAPPVKVPDIPDNSPFKDFFDDFFKRQQQNDQPRTMTSMGSGFIIDSAGLIVTNNHVVDGATGIEVHLHDDTNLKAELVGRDPKTDLAVLRVKPTHPLPTVAFGDSDTLRIGEWVMAIGNPFGLGGSVSLGIVSARNRDINAGPYDDYIQTDAAINKGNSGGPLFNLKGEVVGINTAIFSPTGGSVGIGFSVPANTAKSIVDQLVKYGETRRGWLGVKIQSVTDDIAESMGLDHPRGALIADITKTGPAEAAGIQAGDVVIEFDGHAVNQMRDLPRLVAETEVGKTVVVKVLRKREEVTLTAKVGRLEDGEKVVAQQDGGNDSAPATATLLGMTVSSISDELRAKYSIDKDIKGAVVTAVDASGAAAEKRLAAGDVITEAGEKPVTGASDIKDRLEETTKAGKSSLLLLIAKGGKSADMRFIALKVK